MKDQELKYWGRDTNWQINQQHYRKTEQED